MAVDVVVEVVAEVAVAVVIIIIIKVFLKRFYSRECLSCTEFFAGLGASGEAQTGVIWSVLWGFFNMTTALLVSCLCQSPLLQQCAFPPSFLLRPPTPITNYTRLLISNQYSCSLQNNARHGLLSLSH